MFTHDEWGNTVFHIYTGRIGMTLLEKEGIKNTMTREEYKRHMDSHNRIQREKSEKLLEALKEVFKKINK